MKQRGRTSSAARIAEIEADPAAAIDGYFPPDAPYDLNDREAEEWRAVIASMPRDWFGRETHGLLTQYCRHVVRAAKVAEMIADLEEEQTAQTGLHFGTGKKRSAFPLSNIKALEKLLAMQRAETGMILTLATKMRISQQSTIEPDKKKKGGVGKGKRPWEEN